MLGLGDGDGTDRIPGIVPPAGLCFGQRFAAAKPRIVSGRHQIFRQKFLDLAPPTTDGDSAVVVDVDEPAAAAIRVKPEQPLVMIVLPEPKHLSGGQPDHAHALRISAASAGENACIGVVSTIGCIISAYQILVANRCRTSNNVPPGSRLSRLSFPWQKSCRVVVRQRSSSMVLGLFRASAAFTVQAIVMILPSRSISITRSVVWTSSTRFLLSTGAGFRRLPRCCGSGRGPVETVRGCPEHRHGNRRSGKRRARYRTAGDGCGR